ncbi:MAG: MBL fold metallo-hydrolase [Rhodocyclaceae bacterium]|nr:MBL fold metallo-hydrolase [Rhodocyclaceae bacterium]
MPPQIQVFERGWLSSNNILLRQGALATLVDSGYVSHAAQTLQLVRSGLDGRRLQTLVNTHCHSDHMGGNARLVREFGCTVVVPQGYAQILHEWDEQALLLSSANQRADRFQPDACIGPGDELEMGGLAWRTLAAPGHDMHALMFYCAERRLLISGDALWNDGFGIQFATVLGTADALAATRATLDAIARLDLQTVIPGHGPPFADVDAALARAFARADMLAEDAERMARSALRALFVFNLLEFRSLRRDDLPAYLAGVPIFRLLNDRYFRRSYDDLAAGLVRDLVRGGAITVDGGLVAIARAS